MNLVELVRSQLGGDVIGRLAGMLGASSDATRGAVNAAIPTLLASLGQVASTPDGARRLASMVDNVDDNIMDNVSGGGQSLMESGSKMLSSLFPGGAVSAIGSALSRFSGLGGGAVSSLLGMLMPLILGTLKGQKLELGLDAGGLAGLLSSQKQNIMNAIPAGLRPSLGNTPGLSGLGEWTGTARDVAANAYDAGRTAVRQRAYAATAGAPNVLRWALPLLGAVALGLLVWYLVSRTPEIRPTATNPPPRVTPPDSRDARLAGSEIAGAGKVSAVTDQITSFFSSATDAFSGIADAASAEAALPRLRAMTSQLATLESAINELPQDARIQATSLFGSSFDTLKLAINKAMAIPGVADKIKPVVDDMTATASALLGR